MTAMWARHPSPKTPAQAEGRGRTTRLRGAHRAPPRPTETSWWLALTVLIALLLAAHTLWSLL